MPETDPLEAGDHLVLIDGSAYIFRAYHALPPLTRTSDKLPVGAVAGFCNMLWKLVRAGESHSGFSPAPTHLAVVFDKSEQTFRKEIYPLYKAQRPDLPDDLIPQFPLIREATRAFDLACVEQEGFEADDLMATYAEEAKAKGALVTIISSDKDMMQLVGEKVRMYDPMKDRAIGIDEVFEKFGVGPERVVDVQSLAGDSVDNVPGVPGIGVKTAAQLLGEYGDLDTLLARAEEIRQPKRRQSLIDFADQARLSRELVTLKRDVVLDVPLADVAVVEPEGRRLVAFLKAMEFTTLTRRVAEAYGVEAAEIEPDPRLKAGADPAISPVAAAQEKAEDDEETEEAAARGEGELTPAALVGARIAEATATPVDRSKYETVATPERLAAWIAAAREAGIVALDTETTSLDAMQAELVGVSLAVGPSLACYIPLGHKGGDDGLFSEGLLPDQIPVNAAVEALRPLLEDPAVLKVGQNMKYDWLMLKRYGIDVTPHDDTMLMSYVLDAGAGPHGMDPLSERWLKHTPIKYEEVCGKGKGQICFDRAAIDKATAYAAEDADVTLRLWRVLKPRLVAEGKVSVYETLERPLVAVLGRMEMRGVAIDRQMLSRLSGEFAQGMARLEAEIGELAGEPFNPGSPKQLGDILFGKMGLPGGRKTPTGAWSTGADVLDDLAEQGHELPRRILDWRQLQKLKSTYTDALPTYLNPETGRVHSSFALAATTTGRLSSSEPNLQNIPVRTEEGRKIRKAFVAAPGCKLVSADYSQIELRLLAEIAEVPALRQAFQDGLDIHAMTASEMFGVPVAGMPGEVRRRAKAINFGIIYGISAFGLANQLAIPREEAGAYIKRYFERFPGIRDYMDATRAYAREHGYVETLFGRRCHYPDINAKNPSIRAFNERAAINARLQGTAADIIRRAMARVEAALQAARLSARMLLQVHDELIFEVPDEEIAATLPVITRVMEQAPLPAVALRVPLRVDARAAENWDEAH
ncbi:DNA polymerase I [Ancylobacter sp. 6x-1]|uniref:DNA polymerase I n=1 Tax=Ancylobacter crimeensis TaxID=2579147 RepID=A0ABT0DDK1_9HYPH|nr:DNA polymerase I [Ancylobacter crimeensis]MCK0198035.1 DNA polymerase I [Ancylobacter crimeensis]